MDVAGFPEIAAQFMAAALEKFPQSRMLLKLDLDRQKIRAAKQAKEDEKRKACEALGPWDKLIDRFISFFE